MYKYLLQITFFAILLVIGSNIAVADGGYTTKRYKNKNIDIDPSILGQDPANYNKQKKCTIYDIKYLKKLNRKAQKKIDAYRELEDKTEEVKTPKDAVKFTKKMQKIKDFFTSDEFKAAKNIYKRCKIDVPRVEHEPLFWIPLGDDEVKKEKTPSSI